MTTIGNDDIPGIQTTVSTADTVAAATSAPTDVCLVGPADETATDYPGANEVEVIAQPGDARDLFGDPADSMLSDQVFKALAEGALPVYAVAAGSTDVTGEDLSGLSSTSGSLANGPVLEDASAATFTIDGTAKNTVITLDDPSTKTVADGDVVLNPVTGDFELDAAPGDTDSTNDTVDYTYSDYNAALDAAADQRGGTLDFLAPCQEDPDVTDYAHSTVKSMEGFYDLAVALCGLRTDATVAADMTEVQWDSSRLQVAYPTRDSDGDAAIGSYAGRKASLGLDASAMGKSMNSQGRMYDRISVQDEKDLVANNVVPIRSATGGARIVDDPTTVTDSNSEEAGMRQGYGRLVMDAVIDLVKANEEPFIGRLNTRETRNALGNLLTGEMEGLMDTDAIEDYDVNIREKDALSVKVDVTVDTTDPLRNIYNTIAAGNVA